MSVCANGYFISNVNIPAESLPNAQPFPACIVQWAPVPVSLIAGGSFKLKLRSTGTDYQVNDTVDFEAYLSGPATGSTVSGSCTVASAGVAETETGNFNVPSTVGVYSLATRTRRNGGSWESWYTNPDVAYVPSQSSESSGVVLEIGKVYRAQEEPYEENFPVGPWAWNSYDRLAVVVRNSTGGAISGITVKCSVDENVLSGTYYHGNSVANGDTFYGIVNVGSPAAGWHNVSFSVYYNGALLTTKHFNRAFQASGSSQDQPLGLRSGGHAYPSGGGSISSSDGRKWLNSKFTVTMPQ